MRPEPCKESEDGSWSLPRTRKTKLESFRVELNAWTRKKPGFLKGGVMALMGDQSAHKTALQEITGGEEAKEVRGGFGKEGPCGY